MGKTEQVSDIDGTVTKSNVRGFVLPVLGLSDWKHQVFHLVFLNFKFLTLLKLLLFSIFESWLHSQGVVELYSKIADQGYTMMFLTNR